MALVTPAQSNNLFGSLLRLIGQIRPEYAAEAFDLLTGLLNSVTQSKDPIRTLRLAALAAASKKASTLAIEKILGK